MHFVLSFWALAEGEGDLKMMTVVVMMKTAKRGARQLSRQGSR